MKKIRILYVYWGRGWGGASTSLSGIVRSLDHNRFDKPVILCLESDVVPRFIEAGAEVVTVSDMPNFAHTTATCYGPCDLRFLMGRLKALRISKKWIQRFRDFDVDIVHLNSATLCDLVEPAKLAGCKVVLTVRETAVDGLFGIRKQWMTRLIGRANAVTFISQFDQRTFGIKNTIMKVIPNWVDLAEFDINISQSHSREKLGISRSTTVFLFLGGMSGKKGALTLIKAANRLKVSKDITILIVGSSFPEKPSLSIMRRLKHYLFNSSSEKYREAVERELAMSRSQNVYIHILGLRSDIPSLMAASDVVVSPFTRPHQARPIFEAGAMGKPVIVSDYECLAEAVSNGDNGLLVKPCDTEFLASAIQYLLENPGMIKKMGKSNYEHTKQNHDRDINMPKLMRVYKAVLSS